MVAESVRERRSRLRMREQRAEAANSRWHKPKCEQDNVSRPHKTETSRAEVARETDLPERKLRYAARSQDRRPPAQGYPTSF